MKILTNHYLSGGFLRLFAAVLFALLSAGSTQAALSGNYTINPSASASATNYKDFSSAVSDMLSGTRADGGTVNGSGVSGAVVFKVADGTYTEKIKITSITGASSTNTITFQSANGDSSKVILTQASSTSSTNNYTLMLDGADYIIFKNITLSRTGTSTYGRVIDVSNGATYNIFSGNQIFGSIATSSSNLKTNIYSSSSGADINNTYNNNLIKYGSYSFYIYGSSSTYETGTTISGNIIDSFYSYGIYFYYQDNGLIGENTITNGLSTTAYGINMWYSDNGTKIYKNIIDLPNGNYGINLNYVRGTSSTSVLISNNMVSVGGTSTAALPVEIYYCQYMKFLYNSMNLYGTGSTASALSLSSGSSGAYGNITLKNNNIVNTGGGHAIEVSANAVTLGYIDSSDYNNLYTSGSVLGEWGSTTTNTLSDWQTASGKDANSISADPAFKSKSNLHVDINTTAINAKAKATGYVTTDIDGQARSATKPDIGADEVKGLSNNLGIASLVSPYSGLCAGKYDLTVNISNAGSNTIDSFYIGYYINDSFAGAKKYTASIDEGETANIKIADFTTSDTAKKLKIFVYKPNGTTDAATGNDTLIVTSQSAMAGNYNIGSGKTFADFTSAVEALKNRGVCSAVVFNIENDTFVEQVSIPEITGASASNTITFQSASGDSSKVVLTQPSSTSSADNYTLMLDGADYITFKNITISRSGTNTYGRVVEVSNGASNNTFTNNQIIGVVTSSSSSDRSNIYSSSSALDNNNTYMDNLLKYGAYSFYIYGNSSSFERGTMISGNIIDSFYSYGINSYYQDSLSIIGNTITNAQYTSGYGMNVYYSENMPIISGNIIDMPNGLYGMNLGYAKGTSTVPALVANNMISVGGTSTSSYGARIYYSQYLNFLHNSLNQYSTGGTANALYLYSPATGAYGNITVKNNNVVNSGGGYAIEVYTSSVSLGYIDSSDYNNFYTTGAVLGLWGSASKNTLSDWTTATGMDANSISEDPHFNATDNLHTNSVSFDDKGTPSIIKTDIDGQVRSTSTPDIGADEYNAPALEAVLSAFVSPTQGACAGSSNIDVEIRNGGKTKIDSLYIAYEKNGSVVSTTKYTVSLTTGQEDTLSIGTITLSNSLDSVRVYITKVNNASADAIQTTDTLEMSIQAAMAGSYSIGTGKTFSTIAQAVENLTKRGVCGAVTFNIENGTYDEQITIPEIAGASASNTITFQPANGDSSKVILTQASSTSSANNYTLLLDGADYITFKNITISRTGTSTYGRVVEVSNNASNNTFTNNQVIGTIATSSSNLKTNIYSSSGELDNNNTYSNNLIKYGSYSFYIYGSSSTYENSTTISGNIIDSFYSYGIYIYYQDSLQITGNTITNAQSSSANGMNVYYSENMPVISNNIIDIPNGLYGININYVKGISAVPAIIANNMISVGGTSSSCRPVELYYCQYVKFLHNSLNLYGTSTTAKAIYLTCPSSGAYGNITLKNNNIVNSGGGYAIEISSAAVSLPYLDSSDYNNFYTTGTVLGKWGTTSVSNLSALRTASSKDAYSISADPKFRSISDLHIKALNSALNAVAAPSIIKTDIDGQPRNTTIPDIGADEYDVLTNDLNIVSILQPVSNTCGDSNTLIRVIVSNEGSSSQSSYSVGAVVNGPSGESTLTQSASKTIASDTKDTITFSTKINTYSGGTYTIKAYTALVADANHTNDTASASFNFYAIPERPGVADVARCGNGKVSLTATTATGNTILWYAEAAGGTNFATGSSFTTPTIFADSTYYVSAKNASGCEGPRVAIKAIVNKIPTGAAIATGTIFNGTSNAGTSVSPDEVCPGSMITYEVSPPTTYSNSDYNASWRYNFSLQTANGTVATDTSRTIPTSTANGLINFMPAFSFSDSTVILTVTVKNIITGCDSSFSRYIHILPVPMIAFSAADICGAGTVAFINNTTVSSGTLTYNWYFGDGDTSTALNPNHTYAATGSYNVKLITTNSNGCKDSLTKTIHVFDMPAVDFTASASECEGTVISLSNGSSVATGSISNYMWYFGDGTTSTDENPVKAFSAAGTYSIKLVAEINNGCKDSASKSITINPVPKSVALSKGSPYNGVYNSGTASNPDIVCALYTLTYNIDAPGGYSNADYGTTWEISNLSFTTANGTVAADTTVILPSASGNGKIIFTPAFNTADSTFILTMTLRNKTTLCATTVKRYVSVLSAPDADFEATNVCDGDAITFTDKSQIGGGTGTYRWYFGDGNTSTSTAPTHTYDSAGTYNVSLVVIVGSGCNDSTVKAVTVYPRSVPGFTFSSRCLDSSVAFSNTTTLSSGTISSFAWNFGDGSTASAENPAHTYAAAGTYKVKLVVSTNNGCKDSVTNTVTVYPKPKPNFTYISHCADSSITFTNTSTTGSGTLLSYLWKFGDGSTSASASPAHTYSGSGNFTVVLYATNSFGCKDSIVKTVTVYPKPKVNFTAADGCKGSNISFSNTSSVATGSIVSYLWKFSDGTTSSSINPVKAFSAAGTYSATLIATTNNGCVDSLKKNIIVNVLPAPGFTFTSRCLDSSISFTNTSTISGGTITGYKWSFGDATTSTSTSPTKAFSQAGTYSVKLVVTSSTGCKDSITKSVTVYPKPVPKFTASNTCVYDVATFTNQSTVSSGKIIAYFWRFGDGATSTATNPTHKYAADGSYDVVLRVTTNNGCVDSVTVKKAVTVYPKPAASFSFTNRCIDSSIVFTNLSTVSTGTIASYSWSFGDGGKSTTKNPSYSYATAGTYNVKLVITSSTGCKDSIIKAVTAYPQAEALFTAPSAVCLYDTVTLANASTIASGYNIISYAWDFGDGNTSSDENGVHKFAEAGKYTVTLDVVTANGCQSTYEQDIIINALPESDFTATTVCENGTTIFTNNTVAISQGALNYSWFFGDGATSAAKNPSHKYAVGGAYDVMLVVRNGSGCSDTIEKSINVNYKPVAGFSAANGCSNSALSFKNTSTIAGDSIVSYAWDFGDGNTSTSENPRHTYTANGLYTIQLIVTSDKGCSDIIENNVIIYGLPQADFNASTECVGNATMFKNLISSAGYTYSWSFGDGDSSTLENPVHTYAASGIYQAVLTVTNPNNCSISVSKSIKVNAKPLASFNTMNECFGNAAQFVNESSVAGDNIVSYLWNFGDGDVSGTESPVHNYAQAGTYTVTLSVFTATCSDTFSQNVIIYDRPAAAFTADEVCIGNATQFTNTSSIASGNMTHLWLFDNKDTSTLMNPAYTFATAGKHSVKLLVMSDNGCADSVTQDIMVNSLPTLTILHKVSERNVKFTVSDSSFTTYNWTFGDGGTSTDKNPAHRYPAIGNYNVTLVVTNENNCTATFTDTVNVLTNSINDGLANHGFQVEVYPNPFKEATTLEYTISKTSEVKAAVYDMRGREVVVLVNSAKQTAGKYTYNISAADNNLHSGIYILRIMVDGKAVNKQIIRVE